jgi:hypothetical protein
LGRDGRLMGMWIGNILSEVTISLGLLEQNQ